jgi:hypothetical protein
MFDALQETTRGFVPNSNGRSENYGTARPGIPNSAGADIAWGGPQAGWVCKHLTGPNDNNVIWIDIERNLDRSNRWDSCGYPTTGGPILYGPAQDRATFNGFYDTIAAASFNVGLGACSAPSAWQTGFGTGVLQLHCKYSCMDP